MRIRKNLLISSTIVVLLTVLLLPCFYINDSEFMLGYPLPFVTFYNYIPMEKHEMLLGRIQINILSFFVDVILGYLLFILASFIINRFRNNKIQNT